jgi:hypothetical protein
MTFVRKSLPSEIFAGKACICDVVVHCFVNRIAAAGCGYDVCMCILCIMLQQLAVFMMLPSTVLHDIPPPYGPTRKRTVCTYVLNTFGVIHL